MIAGINLSVAFFLNRSACLPISCFAASVISNS